MSVVGFDVGNQNCFIAIARQGGIEVVTNDYSLHATPTCVSFAERERAMGVAARQQMLTKLKNTVVNLKHLIGRPFSDPLVQEHARQWLPCELQQLAGDVVGVKVNFLGEPRVFTPEQLLAMLLGHLKRLTESFLKQEVSKVSDCVISVPCYFTDAQRRAVNDCAKVADLNCLRVFNETTAVALAYGIYKQDLPVEGQKPRKIIFLDVGHAATQACVAAFNKAKLSVLGTSWDVGLGGRAFDGALREHFTKQFADKYGVDARSRPRAWYRLLDECEKVKKQMSANSGAVPLSIECFIDDKDVTAYVQRSEFEAMCDVYWQRLRSLLRRLLDETKTKVDEVDAVELIGGSTRIPMVKLVVKELFGKEASTTMNLDEAVARGSAMQCAILSPTFRVREFKVTDAQPFCIKIEYSKDADSGTDEMIAFDANSEFPYSKALTFMRKEPFVISAAYAEPNLVPHPSRHIGQFRVGNVTPLDDGSSRKVKAKLRINPNGVFLVSSAYTIEKQTLPPSPPPPAEPMDTAPAADALNGVDEDAAMANGPADEQTAEADAPPPSADEAPPLAAAESPKKGGATKTKTITVDLPVEEIVPQMTAAEVEQFRSVERDLVKQDRLQKENADAKNSVEEYVYTMREKLSDTLSPFVTERSREQFSKELAGTEDWLYDEEERETKQFATRLADLKKLGDPIVERFEEAVTRKPAFDSLGASLVGARKAYDSFTAGEETFNHIDAADMEKVRKIADEKQRWMEESMNKQNNRPLTEPPVVFTKQIDDERAALEAVVRPIVNKPKPKPKVEEKPKADEAAQRGDGDGDGVAANATDAPPPLDDAVAPPTGDMEVD